MLYEGSPDKTDTQKGCVSSIADIPPSNSQQGEHYYVPKEKTHRPKKSKSSTPA